MDELLSREYLQEVVAGIVNDLQDNQEIVKWGVKLHETLSKANEETVEALGIMYEFFLHHGVHNLTVLSKVAEIREQQFKNIMSSLGSRTSEAKKKAAKKNAQKAGRPYEYLIIGYSKGKRKILGLGKDRSKDTLLQYAQTMFADQEKIELLLATKATEEERQRAASLGTIITPKAVII